MRLFQALPTEERVQRMLDRDFVWCGLNLLLDEEEQQKKLCPSCQARAAEDCCPGCGTHLSQVSGGVNGGFDLAEFYHRRKDGMLC